MPVYNGERFLAAALDSVRQQHRDGIELFIVDDGSTDSTVEIVRDYAEVLPIRLITPGRIGNWVSVSNIALREARGDWACFLHQDDLWLPGRIARLWREMETAAGSLIAHNSIFVGPDGKKLGPYSCPLHEGNVPPAQFMEHLLIQNFIAIPSPVFRRQVVLDSGGLDESLWFSADWDLWLRLGALGPVRFLAEALCAFRVHSASQTSRRKLQPNEWEQQFTVVLDRHLEIWSCTGRRRKAVERVARLSIAVNSTLAAASRGESFRISEVLLEMLALGPAGWVRYFRDSRIVQRLGSRVKLQGRRRP